MAFESLDFIYHPSKNVARDLTFFTDVLGGRLRFAVEGMGARVAAIELAPDSPLFLLADHVEGDAPILVYRVKNLARSMNALEHRGWKRRDSFEIPHAPSVPFARRVVSESRSTSSPGPRPRATSTAAGISDEVTRISIRW